MLAPGFGASLTVLSLSPSVSRCLRYTDDRILRKEHGKIHAMKTSISIYVRIFIEHILRIYDDDKANIKPLNRNIFFLLISNLR